MSNPTRPSPSEPAEPMTVDPQLLRVSRRQVLWILALLVLAGWLLRQLGPILTPFFISVLIAYMLNPLVGQLERLKMQRSLAVSLVFALAFGLLMVALLIIIPALVRETADFVGRLPGYVESLRQTVLPWLENTLDIELNLQSLDVERARKLIQEYFSNIAGVAGNVLGFVTQSGSRFLVWITSMVLIPLVTFYLLRDWRALMDVLRDLLPRNLEPIAVRLVKDCDEALASFLRGQLLVMFALGLIYALGLWLVGLNNAVAIGLISGLVSFVPYLGAIIGALLAGTTAIIQDPSPVFLITVAIVFITGQLLESFVLTPRLVGDRIGLHPVLVIFAVLAGGQLFGFAGVLLALPVAAAGMVLIRFTYHNYKHSQLYDGASGKNQQDKESPDT